MRDYVLRKRVSALTLHDSLCLSLEIKKKQAEMDPVAKADNTYYYYNSVEQE